MSPKLNKTWEPFTKKKSIGHVECTFENAAETFRQRSGRLTLKVRKQFWKIRKKITFLKVLLWTSKLVLTTCLKDFNDSSKNCAHIVFLKVFRWTSKLHVDDSVEKFRQGSKSIGWKCKLNWKNNRFCEWNFSKSSRTFRMQLWQNWRNFFFRTKICFARTRS